MAKVVHASIVAAVTVLGVAPVLAQTRGITAEDYYAFETPSDPHFSPDGSAIAFVVTTIEQPVLTRR